MLLYILPSILYSYHGTAAAAAVGYCTVHDGLSTRQEAQQVLGFLCRKFEVQLL